MSAEEGQEHPARVAAADQEQAASADPKARSRRNSAAPSAVIDPQQPCEPCRQMHEATAARLDAIDARVTSVAKIVLTAILAAGAIYFLRGLDDARQQRALPAAPEG